MRPTLRRGLRLASGLVLALALLVGPAPALAGEVAPAPPPTGVAWDYQLGGVRAVPDEVDVVVRDRRAEPLAGDVYDVCYVNGFQTQPDEKGFWRDHWHLVLKRHGKPVVDGDWGEWLLDLRTAAKRRALARIVGRWTDRCAEDGFDAVEYDNLDSFTRSRGLLTAADARAYAERLVARAHDAGLAAAQKNRAQWDGTRVGYDFAIAEQCAQYDECGDYVDTYGDRVLPVEYRRRPFRHACRDWAERLPVLRRDVALASDGTRRWCPATG
ncbi:endo alpha-1,4 polygalactosaminidase [Nocardioides sp. GXQ0305]|uniref:endo alpha-1,4 polygalactosaminidase n=1 Tax=Nocardioides sp. GXQ0305 TaxID=3423912 RepID=UPI003D7C44AA